MVDGPTNDYIQVLVLVCTDQLSEISEISEINEVDEVDEVSEVIEMKSVISHRLNR